MPRIASSLLRAVALALCLVALAAPVAAEELKSVQLFGGDAFQCGVGHIDQWVQNPTGRTIRVTAVETWMGMQTGAVSDFAAWVWAYDRDTNALRLLQATGWDHYAEPTAPGNFRKVFAPHWVTVRADQYFRLLAFCTGRTDKTGGVGVWIEYVE